MLLLSDTYSMVPILIHEFQTTACNSEPEMILKRARLYRVLLSPDQLNSNGYYDGTLDEAFLSRYDRKKKGGRADLRASTKQIQLPSPGESWRHRHPRETSIRLYRVHNTVSKTVYTSTDVSTKLDSAGFLSVFGLRSLVCEFASPDCIKFAFVPPLSAPIGRFTCLGRAD